MRILIYDLVIEKTRHEGMPIVRALRNREIGISGSKGRSLPFRIQRGVINVLNVMQSAHVLDEAGEFIFI